MQIEDLEGQQTAMRSRHGSPVSPSSPSTTVASPAVYDSAGQDGKGAAETMEDNNVVGGDEHGEGTSLRSQA